MSEIPTEDNGASLRDRAGHEQSQQAVSAVPVAIPSASRKEKWRKFFEEVDATLARKSPPAFLQKVTSTHWCIQHYLPPKEAKFSKAHQRLFDPPSTAEFEGWYNGWPGDSRGWMRFGSAQEALDFYKFATGLLTFEEYRSRPHDPVCMEMYAIDANGELSSEYPNFLDPAQAMSAGTAETQSGSGRQPASAVAESHAPEPPSHSTQGDSNV